MRVVEITLRFDYPWNDEEASTSEIRECLEELTPEELLMTANRVGEPVNVDVEVY